MSGWGASYSILRRHRRDKAPPELVALARPLEDEIGVRFASFTVFPRAALEDLHGPPAGQAALPPGVRAAHADSREVLTCISTLTAAANSGSLDSRARKQCRGAIRQIFDHLPEHPREFAGRPDVVCVAPAREGETFATGLGCLRPERSLFPHANRLPYDEGLAIGLSETPAQLPFNECLLIDDVIASGATLIAIMGALSGTVDRFRVFAAHATPLGLWAISRYAEGAGLDVPVNVGHVSGTLGVDFSVVDPASSGRLVLGHALPE